MPPSATTAAIHPETSSTLTTPLAKQAAQKESLRQDVQIVDADTTPDQIAEAAEGGERSNGGANATGPAPMVLAPEERPIAEILQNIVNFRDVGRNFNEDSGKKYLKVGNLFRSGRLDDATTKDLQLLTEKYNIRTVLDLRSENEGRMGEELVNTFPASAINETSITEIVKPGDASQVTAKAEPLLPETEKTQDKAKLADAKKRLTYYVNFAGRKFRMNSVWKPLSFTSKVKVITLMALGRKPRVVELVGREVIEPRGLQGLNYDFVDYCGAEIVQALRIMTDPNNYPLLVHCTQGKDRTGLVIALALRCANIPDRYIIKDYARTQQGLARQRDIMVEEMRKTGLDSTFSDAPPEIIKKTLDYIRFKYGSEEDYLEKNGFGWMDQRKLMACLAKQDVDDLADGEGRTVPVEEKDV